MPLIINTNIASLYIQRSLSAAQDALGINIQRLASGVRINSAKDDPAGLAIADGMTSLIRGQNVAIRNANDAISFSQTADGALSSITENLQRMRTLAVQAANFIGSNADHVALNKEFTQLQSEIAQITTGTKFNNESVFDGSTKTFQIGAGTQTDNRIVYQGVDLTADTSYTSIAAFVSNGVSQASVNTAKSAFVASGGTFSTADGSPVGGSATAATALSLAQTAFTHNVRPSIQATYDTATAAFLSAGGKYNASNGSPVAAKSGAATVVVFPGPNPPLQTQVIPVSTAADTSSYNTYSAAQANFNAAATGVQILDQTSALTSITAIDNALNEIGTEAGKQGALENSLNAVISNLQSSVNNQSVARSRIMDTDYAAETAGMARNQILRQAGVALLTQANQQSSGVLFLLH